MYIIKPAVLCGGAGTRLWPLSTQARPKQFQPLISAEPMLTSTLVRTPEGASRYNDKVSFSRPLVIGSQRHAHLLAQTASVADAVLEPMGRNSAPAVAVAALLADPDDLVLILPADQHICDVPAFHAALAHGAAAATDGQVVTFGIEPDHPATGYGYIEAIEGEAPVRTVERFVEKPDIDTARAYIAAGNFYWNAGIFLFRAGVMLDALDTHAPDILDHARRAMPDGTAEGEALLLDRAVFRDSPSISIDYAVMEPLSKAGGISVVPVTMGWNDIGDYAMLKETSEKTVSGPVATHASENVLVRSEGPFVGVIGVSDVAVIARPDETLVVHLDQSQDVKKATELARHYGAGFMLPDALRSRVRAWLFDEALPFWAEWGWDDAKGGFRETLTLKPPYAEASDVRRMRVQARQIYSFSHAKLLGWTGPSDTLVTRGLDYLYEHCWRDDRGFAHLISPAGDIVDARMDTYDQAFALNALAFVNKAGIAWGDLESGVDALLAVIDERLLRPDGTYRDDDTGSELRRANPHMHLLEAFLALFESFGKADYLDRARRMVEHFEQRFFDATHDRVIEYFDAHWLPDPEQGHITEPGHAFEWASLLTRFDRHTGRDLGSWRRRLVRAAHQHGRSPKGWVYNRTTPDGDPLDTARRLWPQTEMLRAWLVHPGVVNGADPEDLIDALLGSYLSDAGPGGWIDAYDGHGVATSTNMPASTLYHLLSAFSVVLDGTKA